MQIVIFQNNDTDIIETSIDESKKENESHTKRTIHEVQSYKSPTQTAPRKKKLLGPASKRAKIVMSDSKSMSKLENTSNTSTTEEAVQFKMEPYESGEHSNVQYDSNEDETYLEDTMDSQAEESEEYSLVEGGKGEPQASTSGDGVEGQGTWNFTIDFYLQYV